MRLLALLLGLFISIPSFSRTEAYNRAEYLPKYRQIEAKINEGDFEKASRLLFRFFPKEHVSPRAYALEALIDANLHKAELGKRDRMGLASRSLAKAIQIEERLRYYDEVDPEVSYTNFLREAEQGMHPVFNDFFTDLIDYVERVHEGDHSLELLEAVALATEDVRYMPWYCQQCRELDREPVVFGQACAFMNMAERFNEEAVLLNEAYPYEIYAFEDTISEYRIFQIGEGAHEAPAGFLPIDWTPNPESLSDYLIIVHEAVHEKNMSLSAINPGEVYGFYIDDDREYQMAMVDPVSGYELVDYLPDSVQVMLGSTFETYFDDPMEEMGTTIEGIYGMIDELNAYMFETRALQERLSTENFAYLSEDEQIEIAYLIAELDNRMLEFIIPITYYLRMTQEHHPDFYAEIKKSALLKRSLKEIYSEYLNSILWLYEYVGDRPIYPGDLIASAEKMENHFRTMGLQQTLADFVWSEDPRNENVQYIPALNR